MDNMSAYADGFQAGYDGVLGDLSLYEGTHLNAYYNGYQDGTDAYLADSDASDFCPEDAGMESGLFGDA
jgi:hypothetical protein